MEKKRKDVVNSDTMVARKCSRIHENRFFASIVTKSSTKRIANHSRNRGIRLTCRMEVITLYVCFDFKGNRKMLR